MFIETSAKAGYNVKQVSNVQLFVVNSSHAGRAIAAQYEINQKLCASVTVHSAWLNVDACMSDPETVCEADFLFAMHSVTCCQCPVFIVIWTVTIKMHLLPIHMLIMHFYLHLHYGCASRHCKPTEVIFDQN